MTMEDVFVTEVVVQYEDWHHLECRKRGAAKFVADVPGPAVTAGGSGKGPGVHIHFQIRNSTHAFDSLAEISQLWYCLWWQGNQTIPFLFDEV
jgi:hypothetical protein